MIDLSFSFFRSMDFLSFLIFSEKTCHKAACASGDGYKKIQKGSDYRGKGVFAAFLKGRGDENYRGEQQSGYQSAYNAASLAGDDAAYESGNV